MAITPTPTSGALTAEQEEQRRQQAQALQNALSEFDKTKQIADQRDAEIDKSYGSSPGFAAAAHAKNSVAPLDAGKTAAIVAAQGTQAAQINNNTRSMANFKLNPQQTASRQDADTAYNQAVKYKNQIIEEAHGGIPDLGRLMEANDMIDQAHHAENIADLNAQSSNAGVQRTDQMGADTGISGLFGGKREYSNFTAGPIDTSSLADSRAKSDALSASLDGRQIQQAQTANSQAARGQAAQLNVAQSDQIRAQQQALNAQLQQAALGNGPSAAQAQLQRGIDDSLSANIALARSGRGDSAAALKQAMSQNAVTTQRGANDAAMLRAQEQQNAQSVLSAALGNTRAQDIGVATTNAQLSQQTRLANTANEQQTSLANAANDQQTRLANLQAAIDQQKHVDMLKAQLIAQGLSADEAEIQARTQQAQFNAHLLAAQEASRNGQAFNMGQQQLSALGTAASTAGSVIAAAAA